MAGNTNLSELVAASGNPLIDGVLSGVRWKFTNFDFAYPTSAASYGTAHNGEVASFSAFTLEQILAADFGRLLISDYTPLTFVAGNETSANLRYANFSPDGTGQSHGYYPDGFPAMGDIWYSNRNGDQGQGFPGGFAYATILHEIGHTLGLKHGQDIGINNGPVAKNAAGQDIPNFAPLPPGLDHWNFSIMTYRSFQGAVADPVQGFLASDNPVTYMMADIAALQYMYGANFSGPSSTNTLYQWGFDGTKFVNGFVYLPASPGGKIFETIWDGGGIDTYDTFGFSTNQVIDLRPGAFSTIDTAMLADLNRNNPGVTFALGNVANALQFNGDPRSLIENAFTGFGNDRITGNVANNDLRGFGGNDFISGGPGGDRLDGGDGFDIGTWFPEGLPVSINLLNQASNAVGAAGDTIFGLEAFYLTNGADQMTAAGTAVGLYIYGFGGGDILTGSNGSDFIDGGDGGDAINAGTGFDYISYNTATTGVTVNRPNPVGNQTGAAAGDAISNAEVFIMSEFNDVYIGGGGQNFAYGYGGGDALFGGSGANDWLFGMDGNDFLSAGNLNDLLSGGNGADTYAIQNYFTNGFDGVLEFASGQDRFQLSGSGFGLTAGYVFTAGSSFVAGASPAPTTAGGTLLYYTGAGILYYDIDGTGTGAASPLVQITGAPLLQASDFFVV